MLNFIIASVNNLNIEEINICDPENTTLKVFQVIGYILFILKILVPIIIIILGIIEFGKAALSGDEKANTTSFKTLMMKIIAGIMIFFIPTVLDFALSMVQGTKDAALKYEGCTTCMLDPISEDSKPKNITD